MKNASLLLRHHAGVES